MIRPGFFRNAVLAVSLAVLLMSWEYQLAHASLIQAPIPEESIRLRILAHSDSPADQWIKRRVRDEVMRYVQEWYEESGDPEAIRREIAGRVDEFRQIVGRVLEQYGYDYPYTVEYGRTEFPVKPYGHRLYPAGEYESLRIVIGDGRGENWWCVLFPPLCFVELAAAKEKEARQEAAGPSAEQRGAGTDGQGGTGPDGQSTGPDGQSGTGPDGQGGRPAVEVRFLIADLFQGLAKWIKNRWN